MPPSASTLFTGLATLLACLVMAGCSTPQHSEPLSSPAGAQGTLKLAAQAISAYEQGDQARWQSLLCLKSADYPLIGWNQVRSLVGDVSNVRLVKVSEASNAGNGADADSFTNVTYEVQSQHYPLKTLLLKFFPVENDQCVGLVY
ncbi:hypothetical protein LVW35_16455 [Pseudomonas sp. HN11]|uniref:hypothetical protein n=1 Tax=Pseudomonas sp. HN11 TaxID=1344094 RepID=UPI001F361C3F|nr:hypothetical protein [Pseudomonas sp. HN11]UII69277.1 hypothetical protein LVW35_16455 [Pseudomonas sp. HN11]